MKKFVLGGEISEEAKRELREYPDFLKSLLFYRGIEKSEDAKKFLEPDYDRDTYDPFLILGMEKAVERILSAIKEGQKIAIYSDYDADGIPGAVILHDFFKKIGFENFKNYIPNRQTDGYGLNFAVIDEFVRDDIKLVITIDCGITDVKEVERANELGIDVIITDHHLVGEKLPNAFAVLNSKQEGDEYPDKMLCGCGVVFKLIQALIKKGNFEVKQGWEKWLLDMVGLSTLSDMVPLKNENRVFAHFGLKVLRKSPRAGLIKLLRKIKVDQKNLVEDDIGFMITPRINAASRMDDPMRAFEMLSTNDEVEAGVLADHLEKINNQRKGIVATMVKEAKKKIEDRGVKDVVVIGNPDWNPGLLGLVASSLAEEYEKPSFVWGRGDSDCIKGSCRSDGIVNMVEIMNMTASETFLNIGGHKMSGGFSVSVEKIHFIEQELLIAFQNMAVQPPYLDEGIFVDKKLSLDDVNWDNYKLIEKMAPFGEGNSKPLFLFENLKIFQKQMFGKTNNHLKLIFLNDRGQKISAIKFFYDEKRAGFASQNPPQQTISFLANLEKSTFGNTNELRLRIVEFV